MGHVSYLCNSYHSEITGECTFLEGSQSIQDSQCPSHPLIDKNNEKIQQAIFIVAPLMNQWRPKAFLGVQSNGF